MEKCCKDDSGCRSESVRYAQVSVALNVVPYARIGKVNTQCLGEPTVCLYEHSPCGCKLVITQNIGITVPIEYGASVSEEAVEVNCGCQ